MPRDSHNRELMWDSHLSAMNVLLPLVNKEAALAYGKAEYSKVGNSNRDRGAKKADSERCHVVAEEKRHHKLA